MLHSIEGVLAIEPAAAAAAPRLKLERPQAQALAQALATELARHLPSLDGLGLCWMAACFDAAQLLRPGFPAFAELARIYRGGVRDPYGEPQVVTLAARLGRAPAAALEPEPGLLAAPGEGSLLYLPFVVIGAAETVEAARAILESTLFEAGLADARTARLLIDALGIPIEHARLMTRDDLCALTAANLEHAGRPGLWSLLEARLFRDADATLDVDAGDGTRLSLVGGEVLVHVDAGTWSAAYATDPAALVVRMESLRQLLGWLDAHALSWRILPSSAAGPREIELDARGYWIEWQIPAPAAGLSGLKFTDVTHGGHWLWTLCTDRADGHVRGHGFALHRDGLKALRDRLSEIAGVGSPEPS